MEESLKSKTVKGVSWSMIETLSSYTVRFVIGIVLARLLTPNDYGLIGMITIFLSISDTFVNAGFGQAFIQKKNATKEDANTVFAINFVLGVALYVLFWFLAPVIARFFNQPILTTLVRVLFVIIIINSLNIIQNSMIRKELQFKKRAILTVSSTIVSGVIGIVCAYKGLGVWSLVIQQITNKVILCVLLYASSSWHLTMHFSKQSAKEMFSYGSWLMLSNFLSSAFNQIYRFSIGKLFPVSELGYYNRATQFQSMASDSISWVLGTVAFPVFSKVKDDKKELKRNVSNFVLYSSFLVFPLMAIMCVVAKPLVSILLTDKWMGCVLYLQLLCGVGLLSPLYLFLTQLLESIGETRFVFICAVVVNSARVLSIILFYKFGIKYLIMGEIVILSSAIILQSVISKRKVGFSFLSALSRLKWIFISIVLSMSIGYVLFRLLDNNVWLQLLVTSISMAFIYLVILLFAQKEMMIKFFTNIKVIFKR